MGATTKPTNTLGRRIARKRKEFRYTQAQMAELTKVSRSLIGQIELDNVKPTLEFLSRFVRICSTSYTYLIDGKQQEDELLIQSALRESLDFSISPSLTEQAYELLKAVKDDDKEVNTKPQDLIQLIEGLTNENMRLKDRLLHLFDVTEKYSRTLKKVALF